jgi:starch-binding outer membrane protein, SusD/RagB family
MKTSKMMNKKILIGALGLTIAFSACTDLSTNEKDSVVINTSGGAFSGNPGELLASAYSDLGALTNQANVYALYEQPSDEMIPPTRGVDWGDNGVWRTLHQHTWDPTHQQVLDSWNELNSRAFKCNQVLASSPSAAQAAQAKFLRAFYMWHVMDLFGQVPFRDVNEGVNVDPRVYTRAEAFDFIVKDLEEALPNLETKGPAADNGTASKAAAHFMLARLFLNKAVYTAEHPSGPYTFEAADMTKVIDHVNAVTADGYALENDYFANFTPDAKKELVFTSPSGSAQNRIYMTLHYDMNPSGWNGFTTLADFYNKFDDEDNRLFAESPAPLNKPFHGLKRGFLIGQQYKDDGSVLVDSRTQIPLVFTPDVPLSGAATNKGIRVIKYHPAHQGKYVFLRYADAFLMKAEAILRGGTDSQGKTALGMVNELREQRGASPLAAISEAAMLDERGFELYWEGVRRVDQIRFGTFTTTWSEKTSTEPFRVLFPIPQQALDSNPNLVQNDGY